MNPSISAHGIHVEFPIYDSSHRSFKKAILNISTGGKIGKDARNNSVVTALNDLSFEFKEGERIGLLGHNGSGKTTLLRVLSGVYSPTQGSLKINGKTASLLDISMGLDPDASGFENIYLRGVLDGLKPIKIKDKIEEIADFSELGEYLSLPVRTYSSGMMLRLAFAISTSIDAEIIIMDEWLSVGDSNFSAKAAQRLENLVDKASILIMASHDQNLINKICNRTINLEHGKIINDVQINTSIL